MNCQGCGIELPAANGPGPPRKWCSNRCRVAQYGGVCKDCGAPTNGNGGPGKAPDYCIHHAARHAIGVWDKETVVGAIQDFARRFGRSPCPADFNIAMARGLRHHWRIERYQAARGAWPSASSVQNVFSSWSAAIEAAGFAPTKVGGGAHHLDAEREAA